MMNQLRPYYQDLGLDCNQLIRDLDQDLEVIEQQLEGQQTRLLKARHIPLDPTLHNILKIANDQLYGFDLNGNYECRFMRYDQDDHYENPHWDCLEDRTENQRKLSFSLMLNDDYEGGCLEIVNQQIEARQSRLVLFPSWMMHRVTAVRRGTRYVIVGWLLGDHWR